MIKVVAFDLDGTIADTIPMCIEAFRQAVSPYTHNMLSQDDIVKTFGLNEEGMIKQVVVGEWEKALGDFYVIYEQMHTMCPKPFLGIRELIMELKSRSIITPLITGKGQRSCDITLRHFGMESLFDGIYVGSADKHSKSESMECLLSSNNINPAQMVYIGDELSDITACNKVGVRCLSVALIASPSKKKALEAANRGNVFYSIESLQQHLLDII